MAKLVNLYKMSLSSVGTITISGAGWGGWEKIVSLFKNLY